MEEVSAALDDADKRDDEQRHDLHHGADLPHPGGQVDVAPGLGPVEHFCHHPRLEGDHGHDEQRNGQHHVPGEGQEGAQPGRAAGRWSARREPVALAQTTGQVEGREGEVQGEVQAGQQPRPQRRRG